MVEKLMQLVMEEEGQGMTEYGLVLGAIAVLVVGVLVVFGDAIAIVFDDIVATLTGATAG